MATGPWSVLLIVTSFGVAILPYSLTGSTSECRGSEFSVLSQENVRNNCSRNSLDNYDRIMKEFLKANWVFRDLLWSTTAIKLLYRQYLHCSQNALRVKVCYVI